MTHTPGPWAHKEQEIFAADGTCICYVRYNGEEGDPESQDTARLIAAGPDLLAACQIAIQAFGDEEGEAAEQAIADIMAAIARAKP